MMPHLDIPRIRMALDLLKSIAPETRFLQLKNLCENNGIWTVPENPDDYQPVLYEVSLFGVPAIAAEADQLPMNWLRAARNILKAFPDPGPDGPAPITNAEDLKPAA